MTRRLPAASISPTGVALAALLATAPAAAQQQSQAQAHTSGDLVVYRPARRIVFTGDIIATNRPDPLIHLEKNGSSATQKREHIAALAKEGKSLDEIRAAVGDPAPAAASGGGGRGGGFASFTEVVYRELSGRGG